MIAHMHNCAQIAGAPIGFRHVTRELDRLEKRALLRPAPMIKREQILAFVARRWRR